MKIFAFPRTRGAAWPAIATILLATPFAWLGFGAVTEAMISILEARFHEAPLSRYDRIDRIIALGGGSERIVEAIKLAHRFPSATLVISGADEKDYALARAALGPRLSIEPGARNTYQNALFTKRLLQPKPEERWLLVTSAAHMPRAMGCFRSLGLLVHAWPVQQIRPTLQDEARIVIHEWLGLISYWLLGRINTLLPAPIDERPVSDRVDVAVESIQAHAPGA